MRRPERGIASHHQGRGASMPSNTQSRQRLRVVAWIGFITASTVFITKLLLISIGVDLPFWLSTALTGGSGLLMAPAVYYFVTRDDHRPST